MLPSQKPLSLAVSLALSTLSISAAAQTEPEVLSSNTPLMTVVVVGSQPVTAEPGSVTLDASDVLHLRAATSDTATLLRDVPGMSFYGAGGVSSLPVIHGLGDDRLRIKVDGMDLVSACANHMNPPLSYIDPTHVGTATVFAGLAPVSSGGDSIGGTILVDSPAPEFAEAGQGTLLKGEAGTFYRSNGNAMGANLSATAASDTLSVTYNGSTAQSDNYTAGGDFKPAGPAFIGGMGLPSMYNSTNWLDGDEVGSTQYSATNQSLGFALRQDNHLLDLKLGYQHIPYQGFPNQRMDMTDNTSTQVNLGYTGQYDWGTLDARVYREHTEHEMDFLEDKALLVRSRGRWQTAMLAHRRARHADVHRWREHRAGRSRATSCCPRATGCASAAKSSIPPRRLVAGLRRRRHVAGHLPEHQRRRARPLCRIRRMGGAMGSAVDEPARAALRKGQHECRRSAGV